MLDLEMVRMIIEETHIAETHIAETHIEMNM
jgi:hypothetical protein